MQSATEITRSVVLSVDDEPNICRALARCLRPLNVEVVTAHSGAAGLDILASRPVDLIISDMRMPGMTGAEFLHHAARRYPEARRILLTGYADVEATAAALNEGGISQWLAKPWCDDRLRDAVNESLRIVQLTRDKAHLEALTKEKNDQLRILNASLTRRVEARTQEVKLKQKLLEQAFEELCGSHDTLVSLLANVAAIRDPDGPADLQDRFELAICTARALDLAGEEAKVVGQAMQLHRLGLVGVDDRLLGVPVWRLAGDDRVTYQQHPLCAEALLLNVPKLSPVAELIRSQHEHVDGSGYPDGKQGEGIPLGSRIIAAVRDFFDLIDGRLEQTRLAVPEALLYLKKHSKSRYDADVVAALEEALPAAEALDAKLAELRVSVSDLAAGMVLTRDLKTADGLLLLRKNQPLTDTLVSAIAHRAKAMSGPLEIFVRHID